MTALETPLRRILEKQIIEAREVAETAARSALDTLLIDNGKHGDAGNLTHLNDDQRRLRKALLAKEKQLGSRDALVRECAYEQWHTMLFARFLEANDLLMHPEHGASVTMSDLNELAAEEGHADAYAAAAHYAAQMLPGIFRPGDPLLQVKFAREHRQALEALIEGIPKPAFTADDGLGWVYQFWQTGRKKQVNESGRKIGGADISPVTQLFTEHYMVQFMLHNTVGAWWAARHPDQPLPTEKSYLRLNEDGTPAAGSFPGWPATVKELKVIDPCCGSGHFLVAAFALLRRLRMTEEGLSEAEAGDAVLRDNLHGLELDPRCTQLAAFNLTLEAWKTGGYRPLPTPNIACSGLSISASVEDWLGLTDRQEHRVVIEALHKEFRDAPDLGSLINPRKGVLSLPLYANANLDGLDDFLDALLSGETATDPAAAIFGENAQGVAKAAKLLGDTYHLVITNVPYLARGKQGDTLKDFIEQRHPAAKADLATAFVERARDFAKAGGSYSLVTPQNWLFLGSYKKLREELLKGQQWDWVARLGEHAFESAQAAGAFVALFTLTDCKPHSTHATLGLDASAGKSVGEKDEQLRVGDLVMLEQEGQRGNPDARISFVETKEMSLLSQYANAWQGIATSDSPRFSRNFWEIPGIMGGWHRQQTTAEETTYFSGRQNILFWEDGYGEITQVCQEGATFRGVSAWNKRGIIVSQMRNLAVSIYLGDKFDNNTAIITPFDQRNLPAIWCFLKSEAYILSIRAIDQKVNVTNSTLTKVPFDLAYWQQVAAEKYPDGLPEPYSNDPTQWLFKGTVTDTTEPLQVAVARLLGYNWPEQMDDGITPDADGIVPLPALRGEAAAHERLQGLLAGVYGADWTPEKLRELLHGAQADTLEVWLRDKFFEQHSKLFHHRPFIWHVWDGRKDGFAALVNYHALDRAKLEKLTFTYLGAWIDRQRQAAGQNVRGAADRLAAALQLREQLELILRGEPPYDIYVRWKALHEQPRGWDPDLNDGVRLNIRPFVTAGVLRAKVNVKWGKDRGNDPGKTDYGEKGPQTDLEKHHSNERHNDLHFTLEEKKGDAGQGEQA